MSSQRPDAEFAEAMSSQTESSGRPMSKARGAALERAVLERVDSRLEGADSRLERAETPGCALNAHGATFAARPRRDEDTNSSG
jgi:hypothetical protein